MDELNFASDKEELLQTLTRFDGNNMTVEDVVDSGKGKFHERNYHTFFLHVLLENVCNDIEPDERKREQLFNEVCKCLSGAKFLNDHLVLHDLLPLRRKLAQQFFNFVKKIHAEVLPDPTSPDITPDSFLNENNFSTNHQLQLRYEKNFEELEVIARGGFGLVCKVRDKVTDIIYAVKKIIFKYKSDAEYLKVIREAKSIAALNHPNIVSYNSAWVECLPLNDSRSGDSSSSSSSENSVSDECDLDNIEEELSQAFQARFHIKKKSCYNRSHTQTNASKILREDNFINQFNDSFTSMSTEAESLYQSGNWNDSEVETNDGKTTHSFNDFNWNPNCLNVKVMLCIQMEYCDCDLRLWLDNRAKGIDLPFQMDEMEIFKHILNGVAHIHSKNIIHRDLKPQNIFFSKACNFLKIGDFGLATLESYAENGGTSILSSSRSVNLGTAPYAAPEQRKQKSYDSKVDIYSLGIILMELLNIFQTHMEFSKAIDRALEDDFPAEMVKRWPKHINLVKLLIKNDPKQRLSAKEILSQLHMLQNSEPSELNELKEVLVEKNKEIERLKALVEEQQNIINQQRIDLGQ